jgi:DNA-binding NarL/FixJ family response regulator
MVSDPARAGADPISVLILDRDAEFRAGMRRALEEAGLVVLADVEDPATALAAAVQDRPDICLVDVELLGEALNVTATLARKVPTSAVIALTATASATDMLAALSHGASGYLPKDIGFAKLAKALRAAHLGEPAIPRSLVPALIDQVRGRPRRQLKLADRSVELTVREWDVAELLRADLDTAEIARRLGLSQVTVRRHISSLTAKIGARNRAAAIQLLKLLAS